VTQTQRDFLNAILGFIGATSLTDSEASTISLQGTFYDGDTYAALLGVLTSREAVSTNGDRLRAFFFARGVTVDALPAAGSNIFLGAVLE
jgi:hypothetical protein